MRVFSGGLLQLFSRLQSVIDLPSDLPPEIQLLTDGCCSDFAEIPAANADILSSSSRVCFSEGRHVSVGFNFRKTAGLCAYVGPVVNKGGRQPTANESIQGRGVFGRCSQAFQPELFCQSSIGDMDIWNPGFCPVGSGSSCSMSSHIFLEAETCRVTRDGSCPIQTTASRLSVQLTRCSE